MRDIPPDVAANADRFLFIQRHAYVEDRNGYGVWVLPSFVAHVASNASRHVTLSEAIDASADAQALESRVKARHE